ncbi:MAG: glycosyltransferase [Candidatus Aenigmarchaeota archaeon]|nr:glycosyltransferase [Candidatus Aenigmarchaeota archaeon]
MKQDISRLVYISAGEPDFKQAHSIQTFYTCKYLRNFFPVEIVYPLTIGSLAKKYKFDSYQKNRIIVKRLPATSFGRIAAFFHLPGWAKNTFFLADRILYSILVRLCYVFSRDTIFFSRDTIASLFIRKPIVELHSLEHLETNSLEKLTENLEKKTLYKAESLITITKGLKSLIEDRYGLHCHVVPDAYEPSIFDNLPEKSHARKLLGIKKRSRLVVFSGLKLAEKGADILIRSAKFIPDVDVYIVGGGKEEIDFLGRMAEKLGARNVELVGRVGQKLVALYLAASDVLVLPYPSNIRNEIFTSPLKLFEYMSCRRPIVATSVGSLTEVLGEKDAVFVTPGNPKALAEGIKRAFTGEGNENAERLYRKRHLFTYRQRAKKIARIIKNRK